MRLPAGFKSITRKSIYGILCEIGYGLMIIVTAAVISRLAVFLAR